MKKQTLTKLFCAALAVALSCPHARAQSTIYTVAGDGYTIEGSTGISGFAGASGDDASAVFSSPSGVSTDFSGNIYVVDYNNHKIRMISPDGSVSTVLGTAVYGYTSMNGLTITSGLDNPNAATEDMVAYFNFCAYGGSGENGGVTNDPPVQYTETPRAIWKDGCGNLFIVDPNNNRICRIDFESNTMSTVTGGSGRGFSPDGTPAGSCQWGAVSGVCTDAAGNIYVSDKANHVVRMINGEGNVYTIAGTGECGNTGDGGFPTAAKFRAPGALFVNAAGNLYICDPASNVVRVMSLNTEGATIETFAGNGQCGFSGDGSSANSAVLNHPVNVWQDQSGVTYIADMGNARIRSVVPETQFKHALESVSSSEFNIFPSPSNGSFKVNVKAGTGTIDVTNALGQKVFSQTIDKVQTLVNLNQPAGIYDVVVKSAGTTYNRKITIVK